jgi:hypothetical protein
MRSVARSGDRARCRATRARPATRRGAHEARGDARRDVASGGQERHRARLPCDASRGSAADPARFGLGAGAVGQAVARCDARDPCSPPPSHDPHRDPPGTASQRVRDRVTTPRETACGRPRLRDHPGSRETGRARCLRRRRAQPGHAPASRQDSARARVRRRPSVRRRRSDSSRRERRRLPGPPSWPAQSPWTRRRSHRRGPSSCRAAR